MHFLELRADDVHGVLGRLLDRIRVSGLTLVAVEASLDYDGYAVTVRVGTEDTIAVERLASSMRNVVGATLVRAGRDLDHGRIVD
jgi:acetolactate synthase regulatory subunit